MFFELFIQHKGSQSSLEKAAAELRSSGAFAALSELGHTRSLAMQGRPATTEAAAAAKHWNDGYQEALKDICHFAERYLKTPSAMPRTDFGVAATLLKNKEISEEEYENLTGRKPNHTD